jgi:hypothetical protein
MIAMQTILLVRAHSGRIRTAIRDLPKMVREKGYRLDRTEAEEQDLRDLLNEIIGSATAIAALLEIEL